MTENFQASTVDARRFSPENVLEQVQIQDVALSPDGRQVDFSQRVISGNRYCTHLWLTA